jgi:acyl-CoA synthetase (AMP-forming)/AMP-acid ligase II
VEGGDVGNVAAFLGAMAARRPEAPALHVAADHSTTSFAALAARAGGLAADFIQAGLRPGDRALVMLRPGLDFVATAFALLQIGAVPVFVDPGLGLRRMLACVEQVAPRALIAVPLLHAVRLLAPRAFRSVALAFSAGWWPGARRLGGPAAIPAPPLARVAPEETALIAFTTGSTGEPKGVCFTHRVLAAQVQAFLALTGMRDGDVQLAVLPLLALLGPGLGCATVLPAPETNRPGRLAPRALAAAIARYGVTHAFGSPAFAERLARSSLALPALRRVLVGGAPVTPALLRRLRARLGPRVELQVPYGATEAVPLTVAPDDQVLAGAGPGTLVGRALPGVELRLVRVVDGPIAALTADTVAPAGAVGEIAVRGGVVTPAYFGRPEADALAKIPDAGGAWHRMGDLGRLDGEGRLWFCGRKSERIETADGPIYTTWAEPAFAAHPRVARAAVVGVGPRPRQRCVLVIEPMPGSYPGTPRARSVFAGELRAMSGTAISAVLFRRALPLDVRHNAKILRHDLARWAEGRLA